MRRLLAVIGVMLSACATGPMTREKPGATEQEFQQSRYECMRETAGSYSSGYVYKGTGGSVGGTAPNCEMYDACMNARGFRRVEGGRFYGPVTCAP